jgi:predicted amino acid-binding ACT domain protein
MAVTVKKITLWRGKVENRPGTLAEVLAPAATARTDLKVVMGYREPGEAQAVIELFPVGGKKLTTALAGAGLGPSASATLLVTGDDRAGLCQAMARGLADAGINISFVVAQAVGRKFSAVFGFESEADAARGTTLIKKAAGRRR